MKALYYNQPMNIIGLKTEKQDGQIVLYYHLESSDKSVKLKVNQYNKHLNVQTS